MLAFGIQFIFFQTAFAWQSLSIEDSISNFSFKDMHGKSHQYSEFEDKKILFVFLPCVSYDSANDRLEGIHEEYSQLISDNFEVIVVFDPARADMKAELYKQSFPFILTNEVEMNFNTSAEGITIQNLKNPFELIVRDGKVVEAHYGKNENDFLPFHRINQF
jgi:hypothetical protein